MKTKPVQRSLSLLSALAMLLTVFAVPAFAAPSATANLTAGTSVYPTAADQTRNFTVRVENTGTAIIGEAVNWVRVVVPQGEAGISLKDGAVGTPPSGWSATILKNDRFAAITYTASSAFNAIRPGSSQSFTFPGTVARPANSERSGAFTVTTASDGAGKSASTAQGALTATVEILEVLNDLRPISPAGVVDGTATATQTIEYAYSVRNHALEAVDVTGTLDAGAPIDFTSSTTKSVPGDPNAATQFVQTLTLPTVDQDTNVQFTASATSPGADAPQTASDVLRILVPSILGLDAASFSPKATRSGQGTGDRTFSIDASRIGTPQLTVNSGELQFAGTTAELQDAPITFGGDQRLVFALPDGGEVTAADGLHDVTFTFQTIDDNGFEDELVVTLLDLINIDNLAPDITLEVTIPDGQSAVKNGDTVSVTGTVTGVDAVPGTLAVTLQPDVGDPVTVNVSTQQVDGGFTFSGSVKPSFTMPDNSERPTNQYARSFTGAAEVADAAGNLGATATDESFVIDNVIPGLQTPGRTGRVGAESIIEVKFDDVHPTRNDIRGGCDPSLYRIDGVPGRVREVRFFGDTQSCLGKETGGESGDRVLVLDYTLRENETPQVTYLLQDAAFARSFGRDPITDGALNDAVRRTIDTIVGIAPAAPDIIEVFRNDGEEAAYKDFDGSYWTRFGGDDLEVTFGGFRDGYQLQVLDGNDTVLRTYGPYTRDKIPGTSQDAPGESGERTVIVPLPDLTGTTPGQLDGTFVRKLRFLSTATAPPGLPSTLNIGLDTVTPTISALSNVGGDVTVTFSDFLVEGTNFAADWFGMELREGGERWYSAENVSTGDQREQRTVSFGFEDPQLFGGVEYLLNSSDGKRYRDRGGNELADQLLLR